MFSYSTSIAVFLLAVQLSFTEPRVLSVYQSYPRSNDNQVKYDYRYAIDDSVSGVINDRWEHRIGEFVKGAYSLLEPGGKIRTVNYEVDGKRGFHATVHTTNPANLLLSNQQLEKSYLLHPEPPINLRTRVVPPVFDILYKDPQTVPPNYHAIAAATYKYHSVQGNESKKSVENNYNKNYSRPNFSGNNYSINQGHRNHRSQQPNQRYKTYSNYNIDNYNNKRKVLYSF
ncbi:uncharacterized protein LOC142331272 [Lycorma delicatula]|uniref:uncharacterized protein LOC142331272 n=1 Tax=Lycorma delicatula TaxID=130591 RepID=UPI003F50F9EB